MHDVQALHGLSHPLTLTITKVDVALQTGNEDREPSEGREPKRGTKTGNKTGTQNIEPRWGTKTGDQDGEQEPGLWLLQ